AQIQRALAARELYAGDINGMYDPPTRKAVRTFQAARGLESGMLSKTSAQTLGLVELGRNGI
ncbi:peptidoglycan-binding domain-containing protein, partial [Jannaschia helgolandensis]